MTHQITIHQLRSKPREKSYFNVSDNWYGSIGIGTFTGPTHHNPNITVLLRHRLWGYVELIQFDDAELAFDYLFARAHHYGEVEIL